MRRNTWVHRMTGNMFLAQKLVDDDDGKKLRCRRVIEGATTDALYWYHHWIILAT